MLEGLLKHEAGLEMCFPRGLASFSAISIILDHKFSFSTLLFIFLPYHQYDL